MFIIKREEQYRINWFNKVICHEEQYIKRFLDSEFVPILDFVSSKGLHLEVPSKINGWDATFIYRKLIEHKTTLGPAAVELSQFLYMRLNRKNPIWIDYKGFVGFNLQM